MGDTDKDKDRLSDGIKSIQSFLKGAVAPGSLRVSRTSAANSSYLQQVDESFQASNLNYWNDQDNQLLPTSSTTPRSNPPPPPPKNLHAPPNRKTQSPSSALNYNTTDSGLNTSYSAPVKSSPRETGAGHRGKSVVSPRDSRGVEGVGQGVGQGSLGSSGQERERSEWGSDPSTQSGSGSLSRERFQSDIVHKKFSKILMQPMIDLQKLQAQSWTGVPPMHRPTSWRLLLSYLPVNRDRWVDMLTQQRQEYMFYMVPAHYDIHNSERSTEEMGTLRQVAVDAPRTAPDVQLFQTDKIQATLKRLLYIWGVRHPASGYVQGINDLATPIIFVLLSEHYPSIYDQLSLQTTNNTHQHNAPPYSTSPPDSSNAQQSEVQDIVFDDAVLQSVEADSYWCLCKLLDVIQDHYTFSQPGIQKAVFKLKELVRRFRPVLAAHLDKENVQFIQFTFRWINCLLIREMPLLTAIRLYDTYLAERHQLKSFLVYVCLAFLLEWEKELLALEFQELMLFLQKLPTHQWQPQDIEKVLTNAYVLWHGMDGAERHLSHLQQGGGADGDGGV